MNTIEKATTLFAGLNRRDPALATLYVDPQRYVEHDPRVGDGAEGLRRYVEEIASAQPELKVVRAFQDGPYVVTQADGRVQGDGVFFDVFRFDEGLVVEHWGFSAKAGPPNRSGHTQVDGPTEAVADEDTEQNKTLVRDYYQAFHIEGRHGVIGQYFSDDRCVRHEPGVADGLGEFLHDVQRLMRERTIDEIKILLAQGDFVFLAAQGTHLAKPCAYIDLYRAENGKIVEHWGFPTPIPKPETRRNGNGFF
jgi:predicted SnoaL-like aldol condensation-catalyzing enzyme